MKSPSQDCGQHSQKSSALVGTEERPRPPVKPQEAKSWGGSLTSDTSVPGAPGHLKEKDQPGAEPGERATSLPSQLCDLKQVTSPL